MKSGAELIAEERARQISEEGYGAEHDDTHQGGELAGAAACYALWHAAYVGKFCWRLAMAVWPFEHEYWKPACGGNPWEGRIRDLTKAGALIAAEIDRTRRAEREANKPRIITGK